MEIEWEKRTISISEIREDTTITMPSQDRASESL